jgi:hypothetical protein
VSHVIPLGLAFLPSVDIQKQGQWAEKQTEMSVLFKPTLLFMKKTIQAKYQCKTLQTGKPRFLAFPHTRVNET